MLFNEIKVSAGIEECLTPVKHSIAFGEKGPPIGLSPQF
jgi:hypothetical protein